jgi:hypothetical protein
MKFMVTFSLPADPAKRTEGIARFKKMGATAPGGAKFIGRLTRADLSGGFVLLETDEPRQLADFAYAWSDILELEITPVLEDEGLAQVFGSAREAVGARRN